VRQSSLVFHTGDGLSDVSLQHVVPADRALSSPEPGPGLDAPLGDETVLVVEITAGQGRRPDHGNATPADIDGHDFSVLSAHENVSHKFFPA